MTSELETIFTIGVYGSTEESFFAALVENEIELFIDIRARRGLRGAKYKYANSNYLQAELEKLGIAYAHLRELAPSKEIRNLQQQVDHENRTAKRQRTTLSDEYIKAFQRDILKTCERETEDKFNATTSLAKAKQLARIPCDQAVYRIALFCVEQHAEACHRSLVANEWKRQRDVKIEHIMA